MSTIYDQLAVETQTSVADLLQPLLDSPINPDGSLTIPADQVQLLRDICAGYAQASEEIQGVFFKIARHGFTVGFVYSGDMQETLVKTALKSKHKL